MKPIAIFRHVSVEGPGYFADYLDAHDLPWELVRVDAGEPVPTDPSRYAGLVFMGGSMSVNDALPWIGDELLLIRRAVAADVPCMGHCLGGQLLAKAFGGTVTRAPVREIGWGSVQVYDNTLAQAWFGPVDEFLAFHWHGETFSIPEEGTRILSSPHCANQAFVYGKHLGMQCHVEMTPELIRTWCETFGEEVRPRAGGAIQTPEAMLQNLDNRVRELNAVAARLYDRWIEGLVH